MAANVSAAVAGFPARAMAPSRPLVHPDAVASAPSQRRSLRVVEIGTGLAGSVCGRLFAGLGHDVIHCEPPGGDDLRRQPPCNAAGEGLAFVALNADKSSAIAGSDDVGRRAIRTLLHEADVAIVDLPPGQAHGMGLQPAGLRRNWPELVVVWITGFGLEDERSALPGDSLLAEAYGGLATMIGDAGKRPLCLGGEQAAHCSGVTGFLGAMLGLMRRDAGFGGDVVEVAMCDVAAYMDWKSDVSFAMTGRAPTRSGIDPGDWRLVRARDGWVGFIFQAQHWPMVVELIGAPELRDPALNDETARRARGPEWWPIVERWTRERRAEDVYRLAQARGLPFGWVARPSDLVRSAQLLGRRFIAADAGFDGSTPAVGSPVLAERLPWRRGRAPRPGERIAAAAGPSAGAQGIRADSAVVGRSAPAARSSDPLRGILVLDFGTITAGAAVTRLLADYGATVLKIEWPDHPDIFRSWKMPSANGGDPESEPSPDSPYFPSNNIGKLGVAVNLKSHEGRRIVHQLARHCHVLVENYRVGVTRRLGIDARTLHAVNPELLYVSLSSQGQSGPEAGYTSYGSTLDLLSGLASATGYQPGHPLWSSSDVNYPDQLVSLFGAAFVAYSLQRGIQGLHLDISQREVVSWTLGPQIADFLVNGHEAAPEGNRRPGRTPHDTYPCSGHDTWVAISCTSESHRAALADCIGAAGLASRDMAWWQSNADLVDADVSAWTRRHSRADAVAKLRAAGVPSAPVLNAGDRACDARFARRQVVFPDGETPVKGLPLLFGEYRVQPDLHAPTLGEHTRAVLREICGLSEVSIDEHQARGVIHCGPQRGAPASLPGA